MTPFKFSMLNEQDDTEGAIGILIMVVDPIAGDETAMDLVMSGTIVTVFNLLKERLRHAKVRDVAKLKPSIYNANDVKLAKADAAQRLNEFVLDTTRSNTKHLKRGSLNDLI